MNSVQAQSPTKLVQLLVGVLAMLGLALSYLFPFHLLPWTTFYNEWLFGLAVALGLAWVLAHGQLKLADVRPWALVLALVVLHAWLWGGGDPMQRTLWLAFVLFGVVGWLAYSLGLNVQGSYWLDAVLATVWFAAMVSAVIAILQWSGVVAGADWDPGFILFSEGGGRVSSNIGQANNLGTLLVLGLGVVGYGWYSRPGRSPAWRAAAVLSIVTLVLGVYFSGSRTATLNLMLWPVALGVWAYVGKRRFPWLALLPIVVLGVCQLLLPVLIEWWGLFPAQEARSIVSDGNRPRLWMMVLAAIAESPWLGHGFGAVANAHLRLAPAYGAFDYTIAQHAHNTVLDMLANFGVPLGGVIVSGMLWLWGRAWLNSKESAQQFVWLMTTAMLVHAMLEYPLHYGFFFWLLCLLLGALGGQPWRLFTLRYPVPAALGWLAVYAAVAIPVWLAYVQVESLYTLYRQRGPEFAQRALQNSDAQLLGKVLFAEPYERLYWVTKPMDEVLALTPEELTRLENEARWYPLPMLGWRVAFAHAARGDGTQAAWWAERMCKMFDPRVCASAAEEWARKAESHPHWPTLPWDKWLPANPPQQ
jgi:O-antigen ligase